VRVYAVIHSELIADDPLQACKVTFFDYAIGAWDHIQKIRDSLPPWSDKQSHAFDNKIGNGKVPIPRIEWGETTSFTFDEGDTPNQVITFFSFWRPYGDWTLVIDVTENQPKLSKTLDIVCDHVANHYESGYLAKFTAKLRRQEPSVWRSKASAWLYFPIAEIRSDPYSAF
jgi:hypothetical protein